MRTLRLKELTMYLPSSCGLGSLSQSFWMPSLASPSKTNTWYCPSRTWNPVIMSNVLLFRWPLRRESNQTNWLRLLDSVASFPVARVHFPSLSALCARSQHSPLSLITRLQAFALLACKPWESLWTSLWRRQEFSDRLTFKFFGWLFFFLLTFKPRNDERFLVSESTSLVSAKAHPSPTFRLF